MISEQVKQAIINAELLDSSQNEMIRLRLFETLKEVKSDILNEFTDEDIAKRFIERAEKFGYSDAELIKIHTVIKATLMSM